MDAAPQEATTQASVDARDATDRALVRAFCQGETRAFEQLVKAYQNRVFALCFRMLADAAEAEDLAQETFMRLHRAAESYRGEGKFSSWLLRVAANACRNRIKYLGSKHRRRAEEVTEHTQVAETEAPLHSAVAGPEAMALGHQLEAAIVTHLAALEPEHRLLIVLRDIEGLSYDEIVSITGLAAGTVKSRLHRGRIALKDRLLPHLR